MKAFYFLNIDRIMTKMQGRVIWIFIIITLGISIAQTNPYWGPLYMAFGSMILSVTPFTMSQLSNCGFLLMLPATIKDRVIGRFLYGLCLLIMALLFGGVSSALVCIIKHVQISSVFFIFYTGITASALIMLSFQYTLFYFIGEWKSQQLMMIIRMVPGLLLFIIGSIVMDIIEEESNMDTVFSWVTWIGNHIIESAFLALFIGIVIFCLGIFVSVQVQKKRDFA